MSHEQNIAILKILLIRIEQFRQRRLRRIAHRRVMRQVAVPQVQEITERGGHGPPEEQRVLEPPLAHPPHPLLRLVQHRSVQAVVQYLQLPEREHGTRKGGEGQDPDGVEGAAPDRHGEEGRVCEGQERDRDPLTRRVPLEGAYFLAVEVEHPTASIAVPLGGSRKRRLGRGGGILRRGVRTGRYRWKLPRYRDTSKGQGPAGWSRRPLVGIEVMCAQRKGCQRPITNQSD
mmetsp:Transcript_21268/g.42905  ORF Transcript_21268/g.42905 Transcript_21268/m.42905 type:complete len:231 (-) Transcript_21268:110-802(-)